MSQEVSPFPAGDHKAAFQDFTDINALEIRFDLQKVGHSQPMIIILTNLVGNRP